MSRDEERLQHCRTAFPGLRWEQVSPLTFLGAGAKVTISVTSLAPRSWGWRLEYGFAGDVHAPWSIHPVSARFAYASIERALAGARAAVAPMLDDLRGAP